MGDAAVCGCEVCNSCSSLLKNYKFTSPIGNVRFQRSKSFPRRIFLNYEDGTSPCNKENVVRGSSPLKDGGLENPSYNSSPPKLKLNISPNKAPCHSRQRQPLEDYDANSQDSGYGADRDDLKLGFRFAEPLGCAPRRQAIDQSPCKSATSPTSSPQDKWGEHPALYHALSSGSESIDDNFPEMLELDKLHDEDTLLPDGLGDLLRGHIIKDGDPGPQKERPPLRRSLSMVENIYPMHNRPRNTMPTSTIQSGDQENCSSMMVDAIRSFKRPDPPCDSILPLNVKRRKSTSLHTISENELASKIPVIQRSFSENEATIKSALMRSSLQPDLIGDFSRPFALPLIPGRHQDLKTISCETLASLMKGEFSQQIESYSIIDCRYPYEYEGGHIRGAKNIFTKELIQKELLELDKPELQEGENRKRHILIFHCEFSSERGPNLSRFLRNRDRGCNETRYPVLHYPELYLLHGGYKEFFEQHGSLCEPSSYCPMLDPRHETELRHFRARSKSWAGDKRTNLKRLAFP
ncbi:M-phase inducer phosphatase-like isoform X2 [Bacillus rossius redtenbacheri]|uniref:M-phase inducer phosphatase-like isoform X2 n=1 Tax=Bacillus rossius redtenbacheri TaxID=93214 RepID=UPI002FDED7A5